MTTTSTLAQTLTTVMGVQVEITIRGVKQFTVSFDGENKKAVAKLKKYFGVLVIFEEGSGYDEECDQTCIYFTAK